MCVCVCVSVMQCFVSPTLLISLLIIFLNLISLISQGAVSEETAVCVLV